jgi:tryptophan halogenase
MPIPDSLAQRIDMFRENALAWQASDDLFRVDSWVQVMLGQRVRPRSFHRMGALMSEAQLKQALGNLKTNIAAAVARLPAHQDFLDRYVAAPASA